MTATRLTARELEVLCVASENLRRGVFYVGLIREMNSLVGAGLLRAVNPRRPTIPMRLVLTPAGRARVRIALGTKTKEARR